MIRTARKAVGMTQDEVAQRAGVSRKAVNGLEAGRASIATFQAVADVVEFRIAGLPIGLSLGERLATARKRKGWTQARLAERAGLSTPTVRAIERGTGQVASLVAMLAVVSKTARPRKSEKACWEKGRRDVRLTPAWLLDEIRETFGSIDLDPCAAEGSFVGAGREIYQDENGLLSRWSGKLAFVNPPFSEAARWLERCYQAWETREVETVVALVPVRTNTRTFHTRCAGVADVLFLKGRPNFVNPFQPEVSGQTPFGVCLICWGAAPGVSRELAIRIGATLLPSK
ncbi:DNA N-6-adenine-methyltransferase [Novosphingobium sp. TCA1]|uniref:DNA N-6-adenine-methyltransferase n=1 Tax=Novosphingobium sp. TCA1 TaxID=2682474 RepID=UPI0021048E86|nr:DNA N-6-adenine-methyltransferase [Novosphingobium sp. TCA1]